MDGNLHEITDRIATEIQNTLGQVSETDVLALRKALLAGARIFVAGRGRSGLQMKGAAMRLMHLGLQVYVIGDVTTPAISRGDLLLIGSGSGATASLVQYAEKAKSVGAEIALITTNANSGIAKLATYVVVLPAPTPKVKEKRDFTSIQPMGSLFEQCLGILMDSIILQCMGTAGKSSGEMYARHANLE
jgi:6-phospho-3-hexuloisomerase